MAILRNSVWAVRARVLAAAASLRDSNNFRPKLIKTHPITNQNISKFSKKLCRLEEAEVVEEQTEPEDRVDRIERILEGLVQVVHEVHNNNNHDDAPQQPAMPMPGAGAMPREKIRSWITMEYQEQGRDIAVTYSSGSSSCSLIAEESLKEMSQFRENRKEEDRRKYEQRTKFETTKFRIVKWEFISPAKKDCQSRKQWVQ
ncbi:hypothetical protein Acr_28g0010450 [Actinidia rufa]|uniref:Uncharacterized protein n=1 Tax=Actinidia rufa TaxID=165716 RepID=A0A7J0HB58_9ERIC|nr:hypothetical protein Acr_28g0010450 [Actinidia rufa]